MNQKSYQILLLSLLLILLITPQSYAAAWQPLGQKNVKRGNKTAIIYPKTDTPFHSIKLNIGTVGVYIRTVTVIFADGEEHTTKMDKAIGPKSDTPTIDFPGNKKAIKKVKFSYKSSKRSIITLLGIEKIPQPKPES